MTIVVVPCVKDCAREFRFNVMNIRRQVYQVHATYTGDLVDVSSWHWNYVGPPSQLQRPLSHIYSYKVNFPMSPALLPPNSQSTKPSSSAGHRQINNIYRTDVSGPRARMVAGCVLSVLSFSLTWISTCRGCCAPSGQHHHTDTITATSQSLGLNRFHRIGRRQDLFPSCIYI